MILMTGEKPSWAPANRSPENQIWYKTYDNKNHQHLMKDVSILDIGVIFSFPDTNISGSVLWPVLKSFKGHNPTKVDTTQNSKQLFSQNRAYQHPLFYDKKLSVLLTYEQNWEPSEVFKCWWDRVITAEIGVGAQAWIKHDEAIDIVSWWRAWSIYSSRGGGG